MWILKRSPALMLTRSEKLMGTAEPSDARLTNAHVKEIIAPCAARPAVTATNRARAVSILLMPSFYYGLMEAASIAAVTRPDASWTRPVRSYMLPADERDPDREVRGTPGSAARGEALTRPACGSCAHQGERGGGQFRGRGDADGPVPRGSAGSLCPRLRDRRGHLRGRPRASMPFGGARGFSRCVRSAGIPTRSCSRRSTCGPRRAG